MTATGYLAWFRRRGLVSRTNGRVGDLVVWGGGSHIGIYLGNGRAISTLTNGVRIHGIYAVRARFTAFLHTGLSVARPAPAVRTAAEPIVTPANTPAFAPNTQARFTTAYVRLRSGVGTRSRVIRVLPLRSKLIVLGTAHDSLGRTWLHVRRPTGASGWVAAWFTARYAAA
jgi:cell wall-associated NlpC family hydrolase